MKLSIIIPCFNSSSNIIQLLNLLYIQQKNNIEVLIIDDGSTDNTFDMVSNFINTYTPTNFKLFNKINEGAAKAREFGLTLALGEYVFFCDSDDYITSNFANDILNVLHVQSPDLIYFNSLMSTHKKGYCNYKFKVRFTENIEFTSSSLFLGRQLQKNYWTAAVWTFVFKKSLADISKACFTTRKVHEDHMFVMMLLFDARKIYCLNKTLYIQKITLGSLTNSKKDWNYVLQRYLAYLEIEKIFRGEMERQVFRYYREWSIISILDIIFSSKVNLKTVLFRLKFYYMLLSNFDIFVKYFFNKVFKKFF